MYGNLTLYNLKLNYCKIIHILEHYFLCISTIWLNQELNENMFHAVDC